MAAMSLEQISSRKLTDLGQNWKLSAAYGRLCQQLPFCASLCFTMLQDIGQNGYSSIDYAYLCQPMLGRGYTIHGHPDLSTSYAYLCNHMLPMLAYVLTDLHASTRSFLNSYVDLETLTVHV